MNDVTKSMLQLFPSWMKIRQEDSQGAGFLNAAGVQIRDIEVLIENILNSRYPNYVRPEDATDEDIDIASVDIIYKVQLHEGTLNSDNGIIGDDEVYGFTGDTQRILTKSRSIHDFYKKGEDKYYLDGHLIYIKRYFDSISVNGASYREILEHEVWGPYDEIGLLLGCRRMRGERNSSYKARLMDVFRNPGNSSRQGLINFLSRSFGIDPGEVSVYELDDDFVRSRISQDGKVSDELKKYIELSNKINISSSNVYWEILEENKAGLSYLPIMWNLPLDGFEGFIQNGTGYASSLEVKGPGYEKAVKEFEYYVGAEGLKVVRDKIYPEHRFKYRLYATGYKYGEGYRPEDYKYSVIAAELIPLKFDVSAYKEFSKTQHIDFSGNTVNYLQVTSGDTKPDHYITKDVVIENGSKIMNPDNRYIEVIANLKTSDSTVTPVVDSITIQYRNTSGTTKTVVIDTESSQSVDGNTITTGFDSNTWNDANPILRVRTQTSDSLNVVTTSEGTMKLAKGEYQKIYNSEGDWDSGSFVNLTTTQNGTLKLSI